MSPSPTLVSGGIAAAVAALVLLAADGPPAPRAAEVQASPGDSAMAARFLDGMRGANAVQCEAAVHGLENGFWPRIDQSPDAGPDERGLVAWAAGRVEDGATLPLLREALDAGDPCVRRIAARLLGRSRHTRAVPTLLDALGSPDPRTRQLAAVGLGYAESRSAVERLVAALDDDAGPVRAAAAWALGETEDPRAASALIRRLEGDADAAVRRAAAWALGNLY